ncbi:MAG: hypothetical protein SF182_06830 [Deltaproteobacteria bacterium]|nr:hypothetical protein [Deltaproteobacteria bacterium]
MTLAILFAVTLLVGWFPSPATPLGVEDRLQAAVPDDARRSQALAAYEQMRDERRRYDESLRHRAAEVARLVGDQRAPRQAFEQLFGSFDADRAVTTRRILAARAKLRAALKPDEWRAVFER